MSIKKKLAAIAVGLTSLTGGLALTASEAGAVTPCNVGNQGWFQGSNNSFHCTIDANHIVVDRYDVNGVRTIAWAETWFPPDAYWAFGEGSLAQNRPGLLRFCPRNSNGGSVMVTANQSSGTSFYVVRHGVASFEGVYWYKNWAGYKTAMPFQTQCTRPDEVGTGTLVQFS